jgi:hypothetical protein
LIVGLFATVDYRFLIDGGGLDAPNSHPSEIINPATTQESTIITSSIGCLGSGNVERS